MSAASPPSMHTRPPARPRSRPRRWLRAALLALAGLLGFLLAGTLSVSLHPPFHVLVIGVDGDGSAGHRSDTMILVSADPRRGSLSLLSVPRDTYLDIPGRGPDKAGHAFAYGGAELTRASVSGLLDVPVQRTVVVTLSGFTELVDALGGVELEVEQAMYYHDPYQNLLIDLEPGWQRLSGDQAMQYVRYRSDGSDLTRVGRQQAFLQAVAAAVRDPARLPRWPAVARAGLNMADSDLTLFDLAALALAAARAGADGIQTATVPGAAGTGEDGLWYWFPDREALPALLPRH